MFHHCFQPQETRLFLPFPRAPLFPLPHPVPEYQNFASWNASCVAVEAEIVLPPVDHFGWISAGQGVETWWTWIPLTVEKRVLVVTWLYDFEQADGDQQQDQRMVLCWAL